MTATPRTDAQAMQVNRGWVVLAEFARELELELAKAKFDAEMWEWSAMCWKERAEKLEGDVLR